MAISPPTTVTGQIVPSSPTAEAGQTTTEFWAAQITAVVAQVLSLLTLFGAIHVTAQEQGLIVAILQSTVVLAEGAYAVSRGLRKAGTQG